MQLTVRIPKVSVFIWLLTIIMTLSFYLPGFDIGPLSAKIYASCGLFISAIIAAALSGRPLIKLPLGKKILIFWILLILCKVITLYHNGYNLRGIGISLLKNDILSIFMFTAIIFYVRQRKDMGFLINVLIALILLSIFIGFMQWMGQEWAWRLLYKLNPDLSTYFDELPQAELIPGLSSHAFTFGYYLSTLGPLSLPLILQPRVKILNLLKILAVIIGVLILQQRSAIIAFAISVLLFVWGVKRYLKGRFISRIFLVFILIAGSYGLVKLCVYGLGPHVRYDLYRMKIKRSDPRIEMARSAIELALNYPLTGVPANKFVLGADLKPEAAHNIFINTFYHYGIFALGFVFMILFYFFKLSEKVWRNAWKTGDYLLLGLVLGLLGYNLNSLFHNASFVTGDYMVWWIVALLIASEQISKKEAAQNVK